MDDNKKQCKGTKHFYDVVDGKVAAVCRCGNHKRLQEGHRITINTRQCVMVTNLAD